MTNTLGSFAKASIVAEAQDMGVEYDNDNKNNRNNWLNVNDTTGDGAADASKNKDLNRFFRKIFNKVLFWR